KSGQAAAIALLGDAVGVFVCIERGAGFAEARRERAFACGGVSDLVQRFDERCVVIGDGGVAFGVSAMEIGTEAAAIKAGQAQRWSERADARGAIGELIEAERFRTDEGDEIDARIKLRLRLTRTRLRRFRTPARSDEIGAAANQI